jgi:nucleotidyltransferase/DNA polymerase involved in DNA repair
MVQVSVLYCTIPHFAAALARRENPDLGSRPLVLIGPEGRVLDASVEAAGQGVGLGMTARTAEVRCPEAHLLEADVACCRLEAETLLQVLERASSRVEPHSWGAAYVDLGHPGLAQGHYAQAVKLCQEIGQAVRRELGRDLQPALGWDSSKFTAQAAARRVQPGHLRAIDASRERDFLQPLPVELLPLADEAVRRLYFLGLRTMGQYAALPPAAVWQQFGRLGKTAQRCAQGKDDRPVIPRWQEMPLNAGVEFETALVQRERLTAELGRLIAPLLAELQGNLQACGQIRLMVQFDDGSAQERVRTFLLPVAQEKRLLRTLGDLLDGMNWRAGATVLTVTLERIQDVVVEQLRLSSGFHPVENRRQEKLREVQRYLATRFGANRLQRAILSQPGAPLPEWRIGWLSEQDL